MDAAAAGLPAHARLHLLAARGADADGAFRAALDEAVDWEGALALAVRDRAAAAWWARVAAAGAARVPPEPRERLRRLAMVGTFRQARLEALLRGALDVLAAARIPVLLLKGSALAAGVYGSFAERPMADLDLLVPRDRAGEAQRRLRDAGWAPADAAGNAADALYAGHHHLAPLMDGGGSGCVLEVHTEPLPPGHPFAWGAGEMWRHARPVRVAGREALGPSAAHQLLHLCLHFAWGHALRSGAWRTLRDVHALAERGPPDWASFPVLARQARGAGCVYWTLRLARGWMDAAVPDEVLRALRPPGAEPPRRRLERHFAATLFAGADCPSPWLQRRLWELAIRPAREAHGAARPWQRDRDFAAAGVAPAAGSGAVADGWRDLAGWARWLRAVRA